MTRSLARRAARTVALTLGAVVVAPIVLLGTLYVGMFSALMLAEVGYNLFIR